MAVGSLLLAIGLMSRSGETGLPPAPPTAKKQNRAQVDRPLIVERKGNRMLWRLQAQKAEQGRHDMHLISPKLDLFTDAGELIPVKGKEAWFNPVTKSIRFKGDVEVDYRKWILRCQVLNYDHRTEQLYIPGAFRIRGESIRIRGKGLTAFRQTQKIRVDHGVWVEDRKPERWEGASS
ncbi:MAG TPA: LPS export ABC transporter periplasmic protein LptC [Mariprofundaceae bacterium]|nr:LPS export ABC transporter periplasmic protein LptC [Mariprofundaceae bacterium]